MKKKAKATKKTTKKASAEPHIFEKHENLKMLLLFFVLSVVLFFMYRQMYA